MLGVDRRTTLTSFLGASAVLVAIVLVVGVERTRVVVIAAEPAVVVLVLIAAVLWLSAWALSLRTVLATVGGHLSVPLSVLVYTGVTFANNVTPFGQAGGEPFSAALISRVADNEYETSLAAIASADAMNVVPSIMLALVGFGYIGATTVLGRRLRVAAMGIGVMAVAVATGAYFGWRYRHAVEARIVATVTPLIGFLGRVIPRRSPPDDRLVERRIDGFFGALDRVAGDRQSVALALGFSTLGWLGLATSLWLSLFSLGTTAPFPTMLVVVPVGAIAGMTPLPGGLGGVEAVLVALLGPAAGVDPATAAAAVIIHRTATYWIPTVVGGGVATGLGAP